MTDLEPYRPTGLDRITAQGRTVARRLREVEGEAVVRARAVLRREQLDMLEAQLRIRDGGRLLRAAVDEFAQNDAFIHVRTRDNPALELAAREIERRIQLATGDVAVNHVTRQ
ncbi:hypothetical protein [Pseudofrankia sp. BMG5.37]|uniref:hypothetical protein n=1 Tax=Pseudofrankia sp. BMG5.37 TaxID=3050035 RepID=UPI0028953843|nr:hypothetical protein [Pseudofrankia sp. BMG5.37]MDT3438276.1 hypothetical protein [Pseudofrankia sp. BMG5.37]